jgi:hypothetical protein
MRKPTTLFAGTLEITLTHRRPLLYGKVVRNLVNEEVLLDIAFERRQIGIVIESGQFHLAWNWQPPSIRPIYGLRLTFGEAPYPPLDRWKPEQHPTVEWMRQCEVKQFCARQLPSRADEVSIVRARDWDCAIM